MKLERLIKPWRIAALALVCGGVMESRAQMMFFAVPGGNGTNVVVETVTVTNTVTNTIEVPLPLTNIFFNAVPTAVISNGTTNASYTWSGSPEYLRALITVTNETPYLTVGYEPFATNAPSMSGYVNVGQTVSLSDGAWTALPAATETNYGWWTNSVLVATGATYEIAAPLEGVSLVGGVTLSNVFGSVTEYTASQTVGPVFAAPECTVAPTLTGDAVEGQTLTCVDGTWTGVPTPGAPAYNWQQSTDDSTWLEIGAQTVPNELYLGSGAAGMYYRCGVTRTNAMGTATAYTASVQATAP